MATVPAADALVRADQATLWHPASHFDDAALLPPIPIRAARGPWLERADGGRILDAIASWWTSVHGHCEPTVIEAIATQARTLDHVMFAGFTHAPAVTLARGLLDAAGPGFGRVFYADSGSDAIEIAAKLSVQYHQQRGDGRRTRFAALEHGYHGETLGALALCGSPVYRAPFSPLLREVLFLPTPELRGHQHDALHGDAGADDPACERALALLERDADTLAAIVIEPLVQCAGQMRMTGVGFHRRIVERARAMGIHVIADEIAVGFGRTGRMFASDWSGATADFLCLGKGLSGGALPLSAVLIGADIESAFRGAPERAFAHSHTFCGNPIATAAAEASLSLLRARLGPAVDATIAALAQAQRTVAQSCPAVVASRQCGAIVAFTLAPHRRRPDDGRIGLALRRAALARGVLLRPLGDTLYWMPPLCLEPDAIATLTAVTCAAIDEVLG